MGAEKNPTRTVPWATPLLQEVVRFWIPVLGLCGAMMFQISAGQRELQRQISEMNGRLIRVETLLEAHLEDHRRNEAAGLSEHVSN